MPKDYARAHRRSSADDGGALTHGSWFTTAMTFGAGSVLGAIVTFVILVGIPGPWQNLIPARSGDNEQPRSLTTKPSSTTAENPNDVEGAPWGFFDRLRNANVETDATPYEELAPDPSTPREYIIQTASFARANDAERLRGELILSGMDAVLDAVEVDGRGRFYRVLVGPFETRTKAESARNRLRDTGLDPLLLTRAIAEPNR